MPTINVNKKMFLKRTGKEIPDKTLSKKLPYMGTTLERDIKESEFELETYVNRPDFLSEQGLGRAFAAFMGIKTGLQIPQIQKSNYKATLTRDAEKVRPYAVMAVVKNLKFKEADILSLMQLQEKLHTTHGRNRKKVSIGVYDANTIKFPITYKAVDANFKFTPLEETKQMSIKEILESTLKGKEYAHICLGPKYVIWEDSKKQVLSFPPIINSAETALTTNTNEVVIDVTGTDFYSVEKALNIVCYHLADIGGQIYSVDIDGKNYPDLTPEKMKLDINYCNKLLGMKFSADEMKKLLEKMNFGVEIQNEKLEIQIPAYRTDILHPFDLVEEVAISYGYDNFIPEIPQISTIGEEDPIKGYTNKIKEICVGMQMLECQTLHLSNENDLIGKMNLEKAEVVRTTNAVNQNYNIVRNSILAMLIKTLGENTHHEYPQNLFEIGEIYKDANKEELQLGIALCHTNANFSEMRSKVEAVLTAMKVDFKIKMSSDKRFIDGRAAAIIVGNSQIGILGEIHPQILENFGIGMPTCGAEIDLEKLAK